MRRAGGLPAAVAPLIARLAVFKRGSHVFRRKMNCCYTCLRGMFQELSCPFLNKSLLAGSKTEEPTVRYCHKPVNSNEIVHPCLPTYTEAQATQGCNKFLISLSAGRVPPTRSTQLPLTFLILQMITNSLGQSGGQTLGCAHGRERGRLQFPV